MGVVCSDRCIMGQVVDWHGGPWVFFGMVDWHGGTFFWVFSMYHGFFWVFSGLIGIFSRYFRWPGFQIGGVSF